MRPDDAAQVAQSLVHADLTGVFTHGSNFLPLYANWIQVGSIDPTATPEVVSDSGATALISARNAMGQVAGVQAMDLAIEKAKQYGIGAVGVRESNHFGAAAYFTMRALDHDAIGFAFDQRHSGNGALRRSHAQLEQHAHRLCDSGSHGTPAHARHGRERGRGGQGGAGQAQERAHSPRLGLDGFTGEPTEDPSLAKLMAPVGGPKGYGLAVVLDALCGVLTGRALRPRRAPGRYPQYAAGHGPFLHGARHRPHDASGRIQAAHGPPDPPDAHTPKKPKGVERIYLPGEIELERKEHFLRDGIAFATQIVEDLDAMAETFGIPSLSGRL